MLRILPRLAFLQVSLLPLLLRSSASAQHTLRAGSSLSVEDHARPFLVSPDATFSCGFLEAGNNAFSFSVWYSDAANKTAVWTANPDAPVNGRGSRISFRHDGSLALSGANGIGTTVWESKTSGAGLSVSLLDTGNLVISDDPSSSGGGRTLWQSFDWPVDTLVPSQRLTKDTTLVSRYFILYYDNDNVLRLRYDGPDASSIYWPNPDYAVFPNGRTSYNSSRVAVLDDAGVFLSSDNLQVVASDLGVPGIKRRLTIDPDGDLRIYSLESGPIDGGLDSDVGGYGAGVLHSRAVRPERHLRVLAEPQVLVRAGAPDGRPARLATRLQAHVQRHHQLQPSGAAGAEV
jgi:hypothetical protein